MALYLRQVHPCAYEHPATGTGGCGQARAVSARPLPLVPLSPRCSWRLVWGKQPVATADSSPSLLPWLLRGAPLCPGQHPAAQLLPGMPFTSSRERTFSLLRRRGEFAFRVGKQEAAGFQLEWTKEWTKPCVLHCPLRPLAAGVAGNMAKLLWLTRRQGGQAKVVL